MGRAAEIEGPVRTCLGCGAKKPKKTLVRLAVNREGRVDWDLRQTKPGRGAYICPEKGCLAKALKSKRFSRAFRRPVSIDLLLSAGGPWED